MFEKIISILIAPILALGALFAPVNPVVRPSDDFNIVKLEQRVAEVEKLGASFEDAPKVVAFFEDSLAVPLTASGTTFTLVSGKDKRGTLLASSTYGFIIDEGVSSEEVVLADCTGTSCANLARGLDPVLGTTSTYALIKAHGRGASVKITDAPKLLQISSYLNGEAGIPRPIRLKTGVTLCADDTCLATRKYVNDTTVAGAPDILYATKGIGSLSSAEQASSSAATGPTSAQPLIGTNIAKGLWRGTTTVVVTEETGYISPTFIATTSGYAWSASTTFSGTPITLTGSTTEIQTPALSIGGVGYTWPTALGASSTVLTVGNPNGALRWQVVPAGFDLLGETITSGSQSTATVSNLAAKKDLLIIVSIPSMTTGNLRPGLRFDCCGAAEYQFYAVTATSTTERFTGSVNTGPGTSYIEIGGSVDNRLRHHYVIWVDNTSGVNKSVTFEGSALGSAAYPIRIEGSGLWASTTPAQITEVNIVANAISGSPSTTFGSGTRVSVFGR